MNIKTYLDAVDTVCLNCIKIDEDGACEVCPVRQTVDCIYDFDKYEIWFAAHDEKYWVPTPQLTKAFFNEYVGGTFKTKDRGLLMETIFSITEMPNSNWVWVFVDGVLVTYGALCTELYNEVADYVHW